MKTAMLPLMLLAGVVSGLPKITLRPHPEGHKVFVDSFGRERFFHGVNAVVKGPPWYPSRGAYDPQTSLVAEDFRMMRESGLNFIRLGVMWPGVEPEEGQYNQTYLSAIKEISEEAAEHGIYTLADMHQDVLSDRFCGEGVPRWVTPADQPAPFPVPVEASGFENDPATGAPTRRECARHFWGEYYHSEAVGAAFEKLYTHPGAVAAWGRFWGKIAELYAGSANLLGYELINEPHQGNAFLHPELLLPGVADETRLQPAYDTLNTYIRQSDPEGLVFFAGTPGDRTGGVPSDSSPFGFKKVPGGAEFEDRSVSAFHYYTPPQVAADYRAYFDARRKDAARLKAAMFLTESFSWSGFSDAFTYAESLGISWGAWEWKDFCKETNQTLNGSSQNAAFGACKTGYGGVISPDKDPAGNLYEVARTYAPAIAGSHVRSLFNYTSSRFELTYTVNTSIEAPTEVFYYEKRYNGAPKVTVTPSNALSYTAGNSTVHLVVRDAQNGDQVTVTLSL
ncbi:Endoglycoceramidase [Diplonema papillatum]|nr:Endoglycoceramidase [Diplonema papillatum]|eukprot:gene9768-15162_t